MAENVRIEELRRRIQKDPASIAFAQLAEEHRRAREYDDAIRVCHAGLAQHPAYLSARITLGRALLEVGRLDDAAAEFEYVLKAAPDNLTAIRELADIHQRRRVTTHQVRSTEREAPQWGEVTLDELMETTPEPISDSLPEPMPEPVAKPPQEPAPDPVIVELEAWLSVLAADRVNRPSLV